MTLLRFKNKKQTENELKSTIPEISKIEHQTRKYKEDLYQTLLKVEIPAFNIYEVHSKGQSQSESLENAKELMKDVLSKIQEFNNHIQSEIKGQSK